MRKMRWEVEQFCFPHDEEDEPSLLRFRFYTREAAMEHWRIERDKGRLSLGAVLYLRLPGRGRKPVLLRSAAPDPIDCLSLLLVEPFLLPATEGWESLAH